MRGINVGGKNIIPMTELKAFLATQNLTEVSTYIQSGNVLFRSDEADVRSLSARLERALAKRFDYDSRIVLLSGDRLGTVVKQAPPGFGKEPTKFRYDVIFLREPLAADEAMKVVQVNPQVDMISSGRHALYFSRLIARASQSRLSRIVRLPIYQDMTIRNWNTTTKLVSLMDGMKAR